MKEKLLKDLYSKRGYTKEKTEEAFFYVSEFEEYLKKKQKDWKQVDTEDVENYLSYLIENKMNSLDRILALARYFHLINKKEIYIYFTSILGGLGVVEKIQKRCEDLFDKKEAKSIFDSLPQIPLGTSIKGYPQLTSKLMDNLAKRFAPTEYRQVLTGNNHSIPKKAFDEEKLLYEKSDSLEQYLEERHKRKVEVLQNCADEGKVWFEQEINQDVVDFVKSNQEILSAVKKNNKLYMTKIPYAPVQYLKEKDPIKKKYYGCHCPFAREAILDNEISINKDWCYCSAGFAKYPFEIILGKKLKVKVLKSILAGDDHCRFEIELD